MVTTTVKAFEYASAAEPWWNRVLYPPVFGLIGRQTRPGRVLDIGCGNGALSAKLAERGWTVVGIDPSTSGIEHARSTCPKGRFEVELASQGLLERLGEEPFDLVVSLEVVEHVYDPDGWAKACFEALVPGGMLVLTTPYHGYVKNLAISLLDRWDHHHTSLQPHQHIKFWSRRTMTALLERNGFEVVAFRGAGRSPYLWQSMVMSARTPG